MLNSALNSLSLINQSNGKLNEEEIFTIVLDNGVVSITITNLGCAILSIEAPDKKGKKANIVAGFKNSSEYVNNRDYFGCIIGRYANRIGKGKFFLDGTHIELSINDSGNHLHGGNYGFNKKIWSINKVIREEDRVGVVFNYKSNDGEEGYPGNLNVNITYTINNKNQFIISYHAETDKATPINLTNHSYFNLTGFENPVITEHLLEINAKRYTETNQYNLPTGKILEVEGTSLDYSIAHKIGHAINSLQPHNGFNHNYVLEKDHPGEMVWAARLKDAETGRTLQIYTDQPGIQVYTANFWDGNITGSHDRSYEKHGAVALETQAFPDSPNHPSFPNTILRPGEVYFSSTIYEFGIQ